MVAVLVKESKVLLLLIVMGMLVQLLRVRNNTSSRMVESEIIPDIAMVVVMVAND